MGRKASSDFSIADNAMERLRLQYSAIPNPDYVSGNKKRCCCLVITISLLLICVLYVLGGLYYYYNEKAMAFLREDINSLKLTIMKTASQVTQDPEVNKTLMGDVNISV